MKKLTKEQAKAYAQVIKAIERANKKGLDFYGRQWSLVAMNKETSEYFTHKDLLNVITKGNNELECFSKHVLADSGADDVPYYLTDKDDPYKGEYQETPIWQDYL